VNEKTNAYSNGIPPACQPLKKPCTALTLTSAREDASVGTGGFHHFATLANGQTQGFFAEDILAGFHGVDSNLTNVRLLILVFVVFI
jgi:hypothetical protein